MRWDNLRLIDRPAGDGLTTPLFDQGAVVRTFDTPEFRGITFYEVRAKSIINRVPEASRVPFRWTINPYRGCSHGCFYCLSGETSILMGDGLAKPLADVRVGDIVYGTVRVGAYRRYVRTPVVDHWSTVKPAHRVTLADGTELIASGDHRFLTERGWKFVTGRGQGRGRRPFLTTSNKLLGTGGFATGPERGADYRRGYLCGMIRGDGSIGTHSYPRPGRTRFDVHRFRLALVDLEGLQRTRAYLAGLNVRTDEFVFQRAVGERSEVPAILAQSRAGVESIREAIAWPTIASDAWGKGFLAGIFDAEGSYSQGILRISNKDQEILDRISGSLRRLGFRFVVEPPAANGAASIRLPGGLPEHLRFFHTVDPAITRKRSISGRAIKGNASLQVVSVEPLGVDLPMFDITTGTGDFIADGVVSHNCFARNTHTYLDLDYGEDFNRQIVVKVNAGERLRAELGAKSWKGEHIAMGTNVDPYQRAEGRYKLMPEILSAMRDFANPFSILTKGSLILRDVPLLQECAEVADVGTNVSVGFVDRELWRSLEPGTPSPQTRLEVCRKLNQAGIPCGVLMAPIIPFLTDSPAQLRATVQAIARSGATQVAPIVLHLRTGAREWFMAWLHDQYPELVPKYDRLYGRGAYAPKAYQQDVAGRAMEFAEKYGIGHATSKETRRVGTSKRSAASKHEHAEEQHPEQLWML